MIDNNKTDELLRGIRKLVTEYADVYNHVLTNQDWKNPFRDLIAYDIPELFVNCCNLDKVYKVEGSYGKGRWTAVPWIAVFDRRITTSAQKGVYIVYLLNKDTKELYLTLEVAATEAMNLKQKNDGKTVFTGVVGKNNPELQKKLREKAAEIRESIHDSYFCTDNKINSGSSGYDNGAIYYKKYGLEDLNSGDVLVDDLLRMVGLYQDYYNKSNNIESEKLWWPTKEEYDPGITKEQWLKYLDEPGLFTENGYAALAAFFDIGGEATAVQLSNRYGNKPDFYRSSCTQIAAKLVKANYCPAPPEEKNSKFWPVMFQGRKNTDNSQGSYIWKLRTELKEALREFGINRFLGQIPDGKIETPPEINKGKERTMDKPISGLLSDIKKYIENNGFSYDGSLIENFYLSLKSKPFVILAGTSGTGKTRLVKLFAEAIDAKYKLIPVRPDWSDSSDLLGYSDLNGHFHAGEMLKFVGEAIDNPDVPYILCLDEMNLARVEYYLSDILSVIETRDKKDGHIVSIPLLSGKRTDADNGIEYENPPFPENLYIVGTVNMDETTFPFSKKVLDRANTIEFNYVDLTPDFYEQDEAVEKLSLPNDFLKTEYLILQTDCRDDMDFVASVSQELQELNGILKKGNAHVGYRVRDEICFYMLNNKKAQLLTRDEAFDNEIMQKILPRLQGSSLSTKAVLCDLFKEIAGDYDGYGSSSGNVAGAMDDKVKNGPVRYPRSAEKIAFMVRRFEEDGFTSYWL